MSTTKSMLKKLEEKLNAMTREEFVEHLKDNGIEVLNESPIENLSVSYKLEALNVPLNALTNIKEDYSKINLEIDKVIATTVASIDLPEGVNSFYFTKGGDLKNERTSSKKLVNAA